MVRLISELPHSGQEVMTAAQWQRLRPQCPEAVLSAELEETVREGPAATIPGQYLAIRSWTSFHLHGVSLALTLACEASEHQRIAACADDIPGVGSSLDHPGQSGQWTDVRFKVIGPGWL